MNTIELDITSNELGKAIIRIIQGKEMEVEVLYNDGTGAAQMSLIDASYYEFFVLTREQKRYLSYLAYSVRSGNKLEAAILTDAMISQIGPWATYVIK